MAATTLGAKPVGSIVELNVDGKVRDFIVVHQGRPSTLYDTSCDGTWLLMKRCYANKMWHSTLVNDYANSEIHKYLNGDFYNLIDANIRNQIKQVKIPYYPGSGDSKTVNGGANGLPVKIFLLSTPEVGYLSSSYGSDGSKLDYFVSGHEESSERIAEYYASTPAYWWLRTRFTVNSEAAITVSKEGTFFPQQTWAPKTYARPALILPSTLLVSDDGSIIANTAPTMPGSITIPDSIQGGTSIQISWSASTDAENNLAGYKVERNLDGGTAWEQIHQSGATSCQDSVPAGTQTVQYRVKAYDTEGLESGWRTSEQRDVFNNTAPAAPGSITVPMDVPGGGTLLVSWSEASDPDGNLAGYELERQVDGTDEWTRIYKGADTSCIDTITRGWSSVNYRVRAYDEYDAYSPYTTGTARQVNNNRAPTISCDHENGSDLGTKAEGFSVTYSVDDADGDAVTVTEAIDGAVVRSCAPAPGESSTFEITGDTFFKVLNGTHTLTITASDGKAAAVHRLTFEKLVTEATVTLKEPFKADAKISICVLSITGHIPADAELKVEVTNNANDSEPVWEDCTTEVKNSGNHIFANQDAEEGFAFNFRLSVKRGPSGKGGYINSVQGGFQ